MRQHIGIALDSLTVLSNFIAEVVPSGGYPCDVKGSSKAKNPAAGALGRKCGLKGGMARTKKLSTKKRKEIARKAARARWGSKE